ncbi:pelargonidin 3-O-(6-caffeoylglucoside) 5-O-(6-O-malonylglucoside) 4'''-malonyltransferase-like [Salvia splendens]|uniref:pelargonidin 3-O-(6-caffeoylglucoside) 5-O-(6-O-malonylglucoside) 4'''-malonyltransferase-like n=1 Tax=Salvia splendens TaxID=180675 RepID=UPI001C2596EA|nr:pelargonidin 3-O-(6-caffeoylglucoside) 5-O-(6-O-malonylglucoside) 4'''-malonyltransferase-like [Salvia splendens]
MKINIVRRKLIKPCTPTPQNLKSYKLSFKDELSRPSNVGVVLFYQSKPTKPANVLEESLSGILPRVISRHFLVVYPLAVADVDDVEVDDLVPRRGDRFAGPTDPLLSVQITELVKCGGLAVGVSVSHRIFDASSIGTFIAAWSNASKNLGGKKGSVLFPPLILICCFLIIKSKNMQLKYYKFGKESITNLRSKLNTKQGIINSQKIFSKVRLISAVIAKALIRIDAKKYGRPRPSLIIQAVDMRPRINPPLPKHSHCMLRLSVCTGAAGLGLHEIACMISDAIENTVFDFIM